MSNSCDKHSFKSEAGALLEKATMTADIADALISSGNEIKRLREALKKIAAHEMTVGMITAKQHKMQRIAREALAVAKKEHVRLHVYKLPTMLNRGYAVGGGNDVPFSNVDFFDAPWDICRDDLVNFIRTKRYFNPYERFLVLADGRYPTLTFTIEPKADPAEEPKSQI